MGKVNVAIVLDKRRKKNDGTYPVKLKVYDPYSRKQKYYSTIFDFTEEEFFQVWESKKVKSEYKDVKHKLSSLENNAFENAHKLAPFDFDVFERRISRPSNKLTNVAYHFEQIIESKRNLNNISTSDVYKNSLNLLRLYTKNKLNKDFDAFTFNQVNVDFLNGFEDYVLYELKRSVNTLSIYLRAFRTVFNTVIDQKEVEIENVPFGKRKYQIPSKINTKKALTKEELSKLFKAEPKTLEQEKAKDFWFLSYACNGMNINDIARLKFKDIQNDKFEFYRGKTLNTSKANLRPITVYLNDYSKSIIKKYQLSSKSPEGFVFGLIKEGDDEVRIKAKVKNFTRFINQHIKLLAKEAGVTNTISSNWARHSFATHSINKGASIEFMQESLGHKNIKTTQNYFAGFDDETKKKFAQSIMDF